MFSEYDIELYHDTNSMSFSGVSLLLRNKQRLDVSEKEEPVPELILREASILHQYAVAAYTVSACKISKCQNIRCHFAPYPSSINFSKGGPFLLFLFIKC